MVEDIYPQKKTLQARRALFTEALNKDQHALRFFYKFYEDLGDDGTDELEGDIYELAFILQVYVNAHPELNDLSED